VRHRTGNRHGTTAPPAAGDDYVPSHARPEGPATPPASRADLPRRAGTAVIPGRSTLDTGEQRALAWLEADLEADRTATAAEPGGRDPRLPAPRRHKPWFRGSRRVVFGVIVVAALGVASVALAYPRRQPSTTLASGEMTVFGTAVPRTVTDPDTRAVELGMRFRVTRAGAATGVRFYRGPQNAGPHAGHLWDAGGHLLATAQFSDGAEGWQQAAFPAPIALATGTEYVVSYLAPHGKYAADRDFFGSGDRVRGPLVALGGTPGRPNGLYLYGARGGFPTQTWESANYYVDVTFRPGAGGTSAQPPAGQPSAPSSSVPMPPPAKPIPPVQAPPGIPSLSPTTSASSPPASPPPASSGGGAATPGLAGWPNASNTGSRVTAARTLRGDQTVDDAWLKANGSGGAGTQANPYKVDGLALTGMLHVDAGRGTYITVSNSRITGGANYGVMIESGIVTIIDSTIAPASGGRSIIGIMAEQTGTFLRNNISGWNIALMVQGNGPYLIQDNFFHDTFFADGDHTDVINMNPHASNGVIRHNYLDGHRMDGQYTHNGIGLYNDATPGQGTAPSANWTIENNYITRSNYLIYAAATPPFVIRGNVLTTQFQYGAFYDALPGATDGGGNVDENGRAVRISS
jgi:Domain of unknown function (DUF4082)